MGRRHKPAVECDSMVRAWGVSEAETPPRTVGRLVGAVCGRASRTGGASWAGVASSFEVGTLAALDMILMVPRQFKNCVT